MRRRRFADPRSTIRLGDFFVLPIPSKPGEVRANSFLVVSQTFLALFGFLLRLFLSVPLFSHFEKIFDFEMPGLSRF